MRKLSICIFVGLAINISCKQGFNSAASPAPNARNSSGSSASITAGAPATNPLGQTQNGVVFTPPAGQQFLGSCLVTTKYHQIDVCNDFYGPAAQGAETASACQASQTSNGEVATFSQAPCPHDALNCGGCLNTSIQGSVIVWHFSAGEQCIKPICASGATSTSP